MRSAEKRKTGVVIIPYTEDGRIFLIPSDTKENGSKVENLRVLPADTIIESEDPSPGHADYQFPGGAVEEGESEVDAVLREFNEEVLSALADGAPEDVFDTLTGVLESVTSVLVQQFQVDEDTGARTLRGLFGIKMMAIELSAAQADLLTQAGVVTPLSEAQSEGGSFRPYVKALIDSGIINRFVLAGEGGPFEITYPN